MPHFDEVMLGLVRSETSVDPDAIRRLDDDAQIRAFLEHVASHGLLGLVLTAAEREAAVSLLDPARRSLLMSSLPLLRRQALFRLMERDRVLRALSVAGPSAVALKGAVLLSTVYREPVERPLGDLDVLVARDDVEPAIDLLRRLGYTVPFGDAALRGMYEDHFHVRLEHPNGFLVEVHWDLLPWGGAFRLDPAAVLSRSEPADLGGYRFPAPASDDMLVHLATQHLEDGFSSLRRLADIDRIVRKQADLDWDRLADTAAAGGTGALVALSLQLAAHLLGTPIPEDIADLLDVSASARLHLALMDPVESLLERRARRRSAVGVLFEFHSAKGWRRRLRVLDGVVRQREASQRWMFEDARPPQKSPSVAQGVVAAVKLAAYQAALYAAPVARRLGPGPRSAPFWTRRSKEPSQVG